MGTSILTFEFPGTPQPFRPQALLIPGYRPAFPACGARSRARPVRRSYESSLFFSFIILNFEFPYRLYFLRLRHSVAESISNFRAASSKLLDSAMTRAM